MANIRCSINIDTEEVAGYTGLLGAILNQAVKDLQKSYCKLIKTRTEYSYNEFKRSCLFFDENCNGYCDRELSKYILEKALKIEEEKHPKKDIINIKNYIESMEAEAIAS